MRLNEDQKAALIKFRKWYKDYNKPTKCTRSWFEISGAAGTGKTTLAKYLFESVGISDKNVLFVAYVGKATSALAKNGLQAKTIHSAIYQLVWENIRDSETNERIKKMTFVKKEVLAPWIQGIVVDEGSMVPEQIAMDLLSYGIPVIVLGDLNQLPPVMGRPVFLQKPDAILNQIMRQNEDSPIIQLSQDILHGKSFGTGNYDKNGLIKILADRYGLVADFKQFDTVIVGKNITRDMYNKYIREQVYHRTGRLQVGDRIICRRNNWGYLNPDGYPLTNGLVGYVADIDEEKSTKAFMSIVFKPDGYRNSFNDIYLDRMAFETPISSQNKKYNSFTNFDKFEYAYAITCHLAQGSQYDNVYIKYEQMGTRDYCKRWLYTAVTRAVERITLVI